MLKWVDWTVSEPRYFQLQTDHTPVHLALLDEVGAARCSEQLCVLTSHVSVPGLQKTVFSKLVISLQMRSFLLRN